MPITMQCGGKPKNSPTLTANNSGLKPSKLKNYHIFRKRRTSAFSWYPPFRSYIWNSPLNQPSKLQKKVTTSREKNPPWKNSPICDLNVFFNVKQYFAIKIKDKSNQVRWFVTVPPWFVKIVPRWLYLSSDDFAPSNIYYKLLTTISVMNKAILETQSDMISLISS